MDEHTHSWNVTTLYEYFRTKMDEMDRRYQERFEAQQEALNKTERSVEMRFANVNELRGALSDAARLTLPRSEYNASHDTLLSKIEDHNLRDAAFAEALNKRIDELTRRMDLREGETSGSKATWAIVIAVLGIFVLVAGFVLGHFVLK